MAAFNRALIGCIVIISVFVLMIGIIYILDNQDNQYINVQGKVMGKICQVNSHYNQDTLITDNICNIIVGYRIDNQMYGNNIRVLDTDKYQVGDSISLTVRKDDFNDVRIRLISRSTTGVLLLLCIIISLGLTCFTGI